MTLSIHGAVLLDCDYTLNCAHVLAYQMHSHVQLKLVLGRNFSKE
jgi:hypothetical protein